VRGDTFILVRGNEKQILKVSRVTYNEFKIH